MTRLLTFAGILALAVAACTPAVAPTAAPTAALSPTATEQVIPTPVVIVVTATSTPAPPASATPEPAATAVPVPTVAPTATIPPSPTATPVVIIVTATSTPTVGPTRTPTPSPTATPHPAQTRVISGRGATITSAFDMLGGRPVRISVEHDADPHFGVYLRFTSSCVRQLVTGDQVYWRHPSSNVCADRILPNRSVRVEVIARVDTDWSVAFDMGFEPTQLYPPQTFTGMGSDYMPATVIGATAVIELDWSGGAASVDFMRLYVGDGNVVAGRAFTVGGGHQEWLFGGEGQTYMPYVTAAPGVEWTVRVR